MRSPVPEGTIRPAGDDCVDRRQVQAWRHVQPSRTNRPRGLIQLNECEGCLPPRRRSGHDTPHSFFLYSENAPVVLARGSHPVPSRTRKLSPSAPMVLRHQSWESRSPPARFRNAPHPSGSRGVSHPTPHFPGPNCDSVTGVTESPALLRRKAIQTTRTSGATQT